MEMYDTMTDNRPVTEYSPVFYGPPGPGRNKPHLRLHYTPVGAAGNRSGSFPWSVEYVKGPSHRARRETYQHDKCWGALASAAQLWF